MVSSSNENLTPFFCFQATVVFNFIIIISAGIVLVIMTIGLCAASETLLGAIAGIICSGIILGLSVAFQIAMLAYSLPFLNVEVPENLANLRQ